MGKRFIFFLRVIWGSWGWDEGFGCFWEVCWADLTEAARERVLLRRDVGEGRGEGSGSRSGDWGLRGVAGNGVLGLV